MSGHVRGHTQSNSEPVRCGCLYQGAYWRHLANILLNRPCAAAMLTYAKLLCALVIISPHRSTTYVDAAYCYRSSFVYRSVGRSVTLVSLAKPAQAIEMPFGLWVRMVPRNHVSDGGPQALRNVAMTTIFTARLIAAIDRATDRRDDRIV